MYVLPSTVAFSLAVAVVVSPMLEAKAIIKDQCCFPEQFTIVKSSTVGDLIGVGPVALVEIQDAALDFKNNRFGADIKRIYYTGQPAEHFKIVEDKNKKSLWIIVPDVEVCVQQTIKDFPDRCIPDNATYSGSFYFGDQALKADSWYYYVEDYLETTGSYSITTSEDNCIPVGDTFVGTSTSGGLSQQLVSTSGYLNYTQGISDPDKYFNLPDYCKKTKGKNIPLKVKRMPIIYGGK